MKTKLFFRDFIDNLSFHGVKRVFYPTGSQSIRKIFRLFWLLAWLLAFGTMVYQIATVIGYGSTITGS